MAYRHCRARCTGRKRGHPLACSSRTELAGDQSNEDHREGDRDRRESAQPAGVIAEHPFREAAQERRQRGLIVVPPSGMPSGDTEVELVTVIAVTVGRRDQQEQLGGRDRKNE